MFGATRHLLLTIGACCALCTMLESTPASAASLGPADLAWIDKCVADRKLEQLDPAQAPQILRVHAEEIVDDNEPFTVSELQYSYPPAHVMCSDEAGLR